MKAGTIGAGIELSRRQFATHAMLPSYKTSRFLLCLVFVNPIAASCCVQLRKIAHSELGMVVVRVAPE